MLKLAVAIGCICMAIFTYHGVKYLQFLKDNKIKQNYANARYREVQQTYNAENDILKEKIKKLLNQNGREERAHGGCQR